jgi:membrane-associated phospholipid phosphatase
LEDSLIVIEAAAGALLLNQVVKLLAGRQRPYAFFKNDVEYSTSEDNLSFYGGHVSFAFSVVAATVTLASMRGYPGVGIAAGVGFTLAARIGYLRIAADQHYLTDILVGTAGWWAGRFPGSSILRAQRRRPGPDCAFPPMG